jgi:hypothetical protein
LGKILTVQQQAKYMLFEVKFMKEMAQLVGKSLSNRPERKDGKMFRDNSNRQPRDGRAIPDESEIEPMPEPNPDMP